MVGVIHHHRRDVCRHGIVMAQCRCMSQDKVTHIVPCDHEDEPQKPETD